MPKYSQTDFTPNNLQLWICIPSLENAQTSSAALWSFFFRKSCFFGDTLSCREDFDAGDLCIKASLRGEKVIFTTSVSGSLGGVEMAWEAEALPGTGVTRSFAAETAFVSEGFSIVSVSLSIRRIFLGWRSRFDRMVTAPSDSLSDSPEGAGLFLAFPGPFGTVEGYSILGKYVHVGIKTEFGLYLSAFNQLGRLKPTSLRAKPEP